MFGSARNKNARAMIKQLAPLAHKMILTTFAVESREAYTPAALAKLAPKSVSLQCAADAKQALAHSLKKLRPDDALLITGSFYLAGELRTHWVSEEHILKMRKA